MVGITFRVVITFSRDTDDVKRELDQFFRLRGRGSNQSQS